MTDEPVIELATPVPPAPGLLDVVLVPTAPAPPPPPPPLVLDALPPANP